MGKASGLLAMAAFLPVLAGFGETAVKSGDRIAFLGDSITYHGQTRGDGYVNLVLKGLDAEGVAVEAVKAGVSGNNSRDMLARLDRDVLSKRPRWMTLSCGINDVWNLGNANGKGVELDEYRRNVSEILDRCAASNCTVVVMTTTLFESRGKSAAVSENDERNVRIAAYNDFLRAEAARRGLPLADVNAALWKSHRAGNSYNTCDSVHLAPPADRIVAKCVLGALGFKWPEFELAPVFCDHMVLQQGVVVPVWGIGPSGKGCRLSCRVGDAVTWAYADPAVPRGVDRAEVVFLLPPMEAGGPYEMVLSNELSGASQVIHDVWVGEVWLASGQSNMAFKMKDAKPGFGDAPCERLRLYRDGRWDIATPKDVATHTAVGAFFGRGLVEALDRPVGILDLSWGGSYAENWMSRGALLQCPTTRADTMAYERLQSDPGNWTEDTSWSAPDPEDTGPAPETRDWAQPNLDVSDWIEADEPTDFDYSFGFHFNGAAWFRREIEIPPEWAGRDLVLALPAIDKHDITWFNGVEVGRTGKGFETEFWDKPRTYVVPGRIVKAGRAVVAIRIWSFKFCAGFVTGIRHFSIGPEGAAKPIELEGVWRAKIERNAGDFGYVRDRKRRMSPDCPAVFRPHSFYDSLLRPVIPYAMRGAVWYQGESNTLSVEAARAYRTTLAAMIDDWRRQWGLGDFPVGIVQLASHKPLRRFARNDPWAEVRDSQSAVSREVPNVGLVNAIDLGDEMNIHPANKLAVGERLCRWALADVYGRKDLVPTGPRLESGEVGADGCVRLRFTDARGGISATGPVECCYLRGKDGEWRQAAVAIEGETLVVSAPGVADPVEVRYAWAGSPAGATLRGKESGIPVFPFRWERK